MDDVLQNNPGSKLDKSGVPSLETATTVDPNPKPAIINLPITSFSLCLQAVKSIISSQKCFSKNSSFCFFSVLFWCSLSFISYSSSFMPLTLSSV